MSKRYRLVVFDWEGTLGDTLGQIINHVAVEAERLNFGQLDEQMARANVALGLVQAVHKAFPHLTTLQHQELLQAVQVSMVSRHADVYLIPGAREAVVQLDNAGIILSIASNRGHQSLQRALVASGLNQWIHITRTASQTPPKPDPQMLAEIIDEAGVSPQETLMVGDSVSDIEMANAIGVDAVGVDFYHQQASVLREAGALAIFDDYPLFIDFVLSDNQ